MDATTCAYRQLESFYETCRSNKQAVYATYLLIGEVNAEASIDTDRHMASQAVTPSQKKILLVGESQLEGRLFSSFFFP